jgi:hypothetical protein
MVAWMLPYVLGPVVLCPPPQAASTVVTSSRTADFPLMTWNVSLSAGPLKPPETRQ